MTIDKNGNLWIALYGGSGVSVSFTKKILLHIINNIYKILTY